MKTNGSTRFVISALIIPAAVVMGAMGPGLPNLTYSQASVFKTLYTFHPVSTSDANDAKGMNAVAMHKGYLFSIYGEDSGRPGGGIAFYDLSDPRNVKLVHAQDVPDLRESHGFGFHSHNGKDYAALQSIYGVHRLFPLHNVICELPISKEVTNACNPGFRG